MTSLNRFPQYYLTSEYPCSYLEGESARSEVAVPYNLIDTELFGKLIQTGFRRSGYLVYRPGCRLCHACIAVRIPVGKFAPNRSQKRALKRHESLFASGMQPDFDAEHYALYCRYQQSRHPGGGMDRDDEDQYAKSLLQSQVDTTLFEFRENGALRMVSIVDRIVDGLSSVYTFFEPDLPGSSFGTYNILWQIELCRKLGLPYLYLGYWVEGSMKMSYKINFAPLEGYFEGKWQTLEIDK